MNQRILVAIVALVTGLVLSGCGGSQPGSSTGGATPGGESTSVATMYGEVTIPAPEDGKLDVVALGWSDAEMALALGVRPVAVFDWQSFGEQNKGVGPWGTPLFGEEAPTVIAAGQTSTNYEQLQSLNPDVILNVRATADEAEFKRLSEIAPTVYAPAGTPDFATDWQTQITSIGAALGKTVEAEKIITDVKDDISAAARDSFQGQTIVSGAKFGDAYGAYTAGDGRFDLLSQIGFVQNPPVTQLQSAGFFANVPVERISALDADVAVILPIGFTKAQTEADPLIASLPVVRDGRAIILDPASELGMAWGTSSVLSIPVVLEQLVPQLEQASAKVG